MSDPNDEQLLTPEETQELLDALCLTVYDRASLAALIREIKERTDTTIKETSRPRPHRFALHR